jgi:hypothetical protein
VPRPNLLLKLLRCVHSFVLVLGVAFANVVGLDGRGDRDCIGACAELGTFIEGGVTVVLADEA